MSLLFYLASTYLLGSLKRVCKNISKYLWSKEVSDVKTSYSEFSNNAQKSNRTTLFSIRSFYECNSWKKFQEIKLQKIFSKSLARHPSFLSILLKLCVLNCKKETLFSLLIKLLRYILRYLYKLIHSKSSLFNVNIIYINLFNL